MIKLRSVEIFCSWSRLSINRRKSGFFTFKWVHSQVIHQLKHQWGFKKLPKDAKYLGLPLFLSANKSKHLAFVKEKLESHVGGWKCKCLSSMGRVTLIKFVAPIYGMAAFKFPKKLCEDMDASVRFWLES